MCIKTNLLADAEFGKDIAENFIVADLSGNFAERMEAVLEIHREELTTDAVVESLHHALNSFVCTHEGIVMAGLGNDRAALLLYARRFYNRLLEFGEVTAQRRNADAIMGQGSGRRKKVGFVIHPHELLLDIIQPHLVEQAMWLV